jgi:hypothetical protein
MGIFRLNHLWKVCHTLSRQPCRKKWPMHSTKCVAILVSFVCWGKYSKSCTDYIQFIFSDNTAYQFCIYRFVAPVTMKFMQDLLLPVQQQNNNDNYNNNREHFQHLLWSGGGFICNLLAYRFVISTSSSHLTGTRRWGKRSTLPPEWLNDLREADRRDCIAYKTSLRVLCRHHRTMM